MPGNRQARARSKRPRSHASSCAWDARPDALDLLLLGTGRRSQLPGAEVRRAFDAAGVALEVMDTGAACRTYNVLLGEGRPVGAALLAVD